MKKIIIDDCAYNIHPIFHHYAASKDGNIIHIAKQDPKRGTKNVGYLRFSMRKFNQSGLKHYLSHRFIWECFNGVIPEGKVIDHKNDDKEDNRLSNLELMTQQQNCKKSIKNRKTFNSHQNRKTNTK